MAGLDDITKDIEKGKNLEMNLSRYAGEMTALYYRYSYTRLSYNYYTLCEMKEDNAFYPETAELLSKAEDIINRGILNTLSGAEREKAVVATDSLRNEIIENMKAVTAYTDCLQIYEYILNRIDSGSADNVLPDGYSDDAFVEEFMQGIGRYRDGQIINAQIMAAIGQLPVRLTRQKYYELIRDAFSLYNGSSKDSVDEFVYMLRSLAMLDRPAGFEDKYPAVYAFIKELEECDYDSLTKEQCKSYAGRIEETATFLYGLSDECFLLGEVVNDIYVILLAEPYAVSDCKEINMCRVLLGAETQTDSGEAYEALEKLEGIQERLYEKFSKYDFIIDSKDKYKDIIESTMLTSVYAALSRITKLVSTSIFIEFDKEKDLGQADSGYVDTARDSLIAELAALFEGKPRRLVRSVMAATMSALPMFFENGNELEAYIRHALVSCSDIAEKAAGVNLVRGIMREYDIDDIDVE